ncbi:hypothetical protein [Phyllobacterium sp. SB3]|uniref:hypothetical protein n=1 Tax=Phyllobacterium sp. SB3 TaxID=3156073 RepID=UPI0032AF1A5A
MKRVISAIGAGIVAVLIGFTSVVSSYAAPIAPMQVQVSTNVEKAQYREKRKHRVEKRHDRRDRYERHDRRSHFENRRERERRWNGHRGYREKRSGYRRGHDGWWYPRAAFIIRVK